MLNCQGVKQWKSVTWGTSDCSPCGITYVREAGKHFIEPLSRMWINFLLVHKKFLSRVDKGFIIIIALAWIMTINDAWVYFVYKICHLQLKPHIICSFPAFSSVADLKKSIICFQNVYLSNFSFASQCQKKWKIRNIWKILIEQDWYQAGIE